MKNKLTSILLLNKINNRIYGLDILRTMAILFVVIGHGGIYLPDSVKTIIDYFILDGVSLFFVLSGFLIGQIIIKTFEENSINYKTMIGFWLKRWFRTLPNYYLFLFLFIFILPLVFYGSIYNPIRYIDFFFQ